MANYVKRELITLGALFLRKSQSTWGRYRITKILLPWLRSSGSCMGTRIIKTRYGFRFKADLADWLGQYVYLTGSYEPPTSEIFTALIKPGDTMLDIGANVGYFSLLCATLTGTTGRVIAFEPIPSVRENLKANIALNNFKHIEVISKAVSDVAASLTIYEGPEGHKGISSLRPLETGSRELIIESLALDDIADDIKEVNCIKIDVEGAEMKALIGMEKLVARFKPFFIIEFTDEYLKSFGHSSSLLEEWLVSRGYQLFRIEESSLFPLDLSASGLPAQYNVLAAQALPQALSKLIDHKCLITDS